MPVVVGRWSNRRERYINGTYVGKLESLFRRYFDTSKSFSTFPPWDHERVASERFPGQSNLADVGVRGIVPTAYR